MEKLKIELLDVACKTEQSVRGLCSLWADKVSFIPVFVFLIPKNARTKSKLPLTELNFKFKNNKYRNPCMQQTKRALVNLFWIFDWLKKWGAYFPFFGFGVFKGINRFVNCPIPTYRHTYRRESTYNIGVGAYLSL